jgi:hypothetical protein
MLLYLEICAQTMYPPAFQPHPSFFSDFYIFYSYFYFMIVNITIFGNVRTDHVFTTHPPPPSSLIFSGFFEHFTTVFQLGLPKTTKTLTVGNHQFLWEKGKFLH